MYGRTLPYKSDHKVARSSPGYPHKKQSSPEQQQELLRMLRQASLSWSDMRWTPKPPTRAGKEFCASEHFMMCTMPARVSCSTWLRAPNASDMRAARVKCENHRLEGPAKKQLSFLCCADKAARAHARRAEPSCQLQLTGAFALLYLSGCIQEEVVPDMCYCEGRTPCHCDEVPCEGRRWAIVGFCTMRS